MSVPSRVLTFAMFPLGLGGLVIGVHDAVEGHRSLAWPVVQGTVLSSQLTSRFFQPDQATLRYQYVFNGKPHVSNQLWPGSMDSFPVLRRKTSEQIIASHPVGSTMPVYVNTKEDSAVLFPGAGRAKRWVLTIIIFLGIGMWAPLALDRS